MVILVTGAAGFIGHAVSSALLDRGDEVVGIDNLNDYYDVNLKKSRLDNLRKAKNFTFLQEDIIRQEPLFNLFKQHKPKHVIHLAAQAGVRYSLKNPHAYIHSNIQGFMNILEACRYNDIEHLVYASTSSVYGANTKMPFSVHDNVDHPLSMYAATKKANELMAHTYSHLYQLPTTGLRFFTVYGPWGRPDMSMFIFTRNIINGEPIDVYNNGHHARDFTYIDDIVNGVVCVVDKIAEPNPDWTGENPDPASSNAPYRIYNIGNNRPTNLMDYIHLIEEHVGKKAVINFLPMQAGDVPATYADIEDLARDVGYCPTTPIETGIANFIAWYKAFYRVE